jgi:hypothetical protein
MLKPIALALMLVVGTGAGHRVRQRRQHAAGARVGASEGNRHPPRDRREPRRLVQQLLVESVVMASLGASAGVALAWLLDAGGDVGEPADPDSAVLRAPARWRVLLFTAVVTMIAAVVAGLAPALKATRRTW